MRVSHAASAVFDDPNLVSCAGLAPVLALAERCGLHRLVAESVTLSGPAAANASVKVPALVAGMIAGADSIDDMDLLRHGGMGRLFGGVRAPSTLGSFLRTFRFGQVRQLDKVAARLLANLAGHTPLLRDADQMVLVDVDDTVRATYGYAKQGAGYGYTKVKGLNALIGTVSTPTSAPVIAATRLRKGASNSARGAARLVADTLAAAKRCGAAGMVLVRCDSAFYNADAVAAIGRGGARFSITARLDAAVKAAISAIAETAWTTIHYPNAIYDEDQQAWISDAEVAETSYTAFGSRRIADQVSGRLIVRRVRRLNPAGDQQGELLPGYRYHAVFTNSTLPLIQAEHCHRGHAIIEQVIADLKNGPLAHLPSFAANSAWLVCAAIAFNLTRAAGCLASAFHAKATTGTLRDQLINLPARLARSARRLVLHLPADWPWEQAWTNLFTTACGPPTAAT
jgi:Transposase DDE domain group 1